jgi:branched-chain amino acid transport system substrate-binding protein
MKVLKTIVAAAAAMFAVGSVHAQNEQFIPMNGYWVGPYAPGGSGYFGGMIDYLDMLNKRDGGIGGVKITWEKCETEYITARGVECYERSKKKGPTGATVIHPLSTGITYGVMDKASVDKVPVISMGYGNTAAADGRAWPWVFPLITTYWSQVSAMVKYIGSLEGGMDKLKGKKIALVYHDSAYGKEPHSVLLADAKRYGFDTQLIAVAHPGNTQEAQWLQVRQAKPDYVILWGWGIMNTVALKTAAKTGFPREKIIGVWWAGAEEDVVPAGEASKGYTAAGFNVAGANFPVISEIKKHVYAKGKGEMEDQARIGSVYYNRGVVSGIITAEAIRIAQAKYGKKPITGEQMRWGIENLNIDAKRLAELGAAGFMPDLKVSCEDHEGSGKVKFQKWDGTKWTIVTDWIEGDKAMVRPMLEQAAAAQAKEKNINVGCLPAPA